MKLEAIKISGLAVCLSLVSGSSIASAGFSFSEPAPTKEVSVVEESKLLTLLVAEPPTKFTAVEVKIPLPPTPVAEKPGQFSEQDLIDVLKFVGFEGKALRQAWAVAMKESTGRPKTHNDNPRTGDNSYGLFQINMKGSLGPDRLERYGLESYKDLFDPRTNAKIAYQMSKGGTNWGAWGIGPDAYNGGTTGSYYKWLEQYPGE